MALPTIDEMKKLVEQLDTDKSGNITMDELQGLKENFYIALRNYVTTKKYIWGEMSESLLENINFETDIFRDIKKMYTIFKEQDTDDDEMINRQELENALNNSDTYLFCLDNEAYPTEYKNLFDITELSETDLIHFDDFVKISQINERAYKELFIQDKIINVFISEHSEDLGIPKISKKFTKCILSAATTDDRKKLFEELEPNECGMITMDKIELALINNSLISLNDFSVRSISAMHHICHMQFRHFEKFCEDLQKWYITFKKYDIDGSGKVDCEGFKKALIDVKLYCDVMDEYRHQIVSIIGVEITVETFKDIVLQNMTLSSEGDFNDFVKNCCIMIYMISQGFANVIRPCLIITGGFSPISRPSTYLTKCIEVLPTIDDLQKLFIKLDSKQSGSVTVGQLQNAFDCEKFDNKGNDKLWSILSTSLRANRVLMKDLDDEKEVNFEYVQDCYEHAVIAYAKFKGEMTNEDGKVCCDGDLYDISKWMSDVRYAADMTEFMNGLNISECSVLNALKSEEFNCNRTNRIGAADIVFVDLDDYIKIYMLTHFIEAEKWVAVQDIRQIQAS